MHSNPEFAADMEAARAEYYEKSGRKPNTVIDYPDGRRILSQPIDTASYRYYGDMAQYLAAKGQRATQRGAQAKADADFSLDAVLAAFSEPLGLKMDSKSTPALVSLLYDSRHALQRNALELGDAATFRKRPYVQVGDEPFAGGLDYSKTSSYPSAESEIGWGIALILTEIAPARANELLALGYRMGESGIITGQHWATDIVAARIMAAGMVARLHTDAAFNKLLRDAKKEYASKTTKP